MKTVLTSLMVVIGVLASAGLSRTIYVSPNGRDSNPGTQEAPLQTLSGARDVLRRSQRERHTVYLLDGRYPIRTSIELSEQDSGQAGAEVVYKAYHPGRVFLDGGLTVSPQVCKPVTDRSILNRLLPEAAPEVQQIDLKALGITHYGQLGPRGFSRSYRPAPLELFTDSRPGIIARWPNPGEPLIKLGKVLDKGSTPRTGDYSNRGGVFEYVTPRAKRWTRAKDLYISGIFAHGYAEDTIPVAKLDIEKGTLQTACPHLYGIGNGQKSLHKWYALNLIEEIDQPGEYCIDSETGILYFYPLTAIKATTQLQVSILEEPMIVMENASYIQLEGIVFENARGTAVYIEGGSQNKLAGCTFRNLGIVAVQIGQGTTAAADGYHNAHGEGNPENLPHPVSRKLGSFHNYIYAHTEWNRHGGTGHQIVSCNIYNTGAGGIVLGGGDRKTLTPAGNRVENCDIHDVNRWDRTYKTPVNIDGVGNIIRHCDLHDCSGQAILLHGNDHIIEYNTIHHVLKDMSDQGAIYSGRDPSEAGTQIRYNFFHHLIYGHEGGYGIQGLFFDDYGTNTAQVIGNVFYKAGSTGVIKFFRGGEVPIINNIMIDCPRPLERLRCDHDNLLKFMHEDPLGRRRVREAVDITQPPYSEKYPVLKALYDNKHKLGHPFERNYVVKGDLSEFVDPNHLNFQLKEDSKVYNEIKGFERIPFEKIGLYADSYRKELK